jgi:hypothetical protein
MDEGRDEVTMTTEEKRNAEEIRKEIHGTITEMGRTLDEIKHRLSPEELKSQAMEKWRGITGRYKAKERWQEVTGSAAVVKERMGERMQGYQGVFKETVREHPGPSVLVGIGLGWFLMAMIKERKDRKMGRHYPAECHYYYSGETGTMEQICPPGSEGSELGETAGAKAGETKEKMSRKAGEWKGQMTHSAEHARERASRFGSEARGRISQTKHEMNYQMQDNPMSMGIMALAAGAVIGLIIPESRWEDRMLGEKRDEFMHRAREKGAEQVQKAKHAMEETVQKSKKTFTEEMKKEEEPAI